MLRTFCHSTMYMYFTVVLFLHNRYQACTYLFQSKFNSDVSSITFKFSDKMKRPITTSLMANSGDFILTGATGVKLQQGTLQDYNKGQLISKCPFSVYKSHQKTNEILSRISALASKKRSNQKNKLTLYHYLEDFILTL